VRIEEVTDDEFAAYQSDGGRTGRTAAATSAASYGGGSSSSASPRPMPHVPRDMPAGTVLIMGLDGVDDLGVRLGGVFGTHPFSEPNHLGGGFVQSGEMPMLIPVPLAAPSRPVVQALPVTLDALYHGGSLSCAIRSQVATSLGPLEPERVKIFQVEILPGYKHGTKIKFDASFPEDELYPGEPKVDVTFVLSVEPHGVYSRKGDDLYTPFRLTKEALLAESFEKPLKLLSGRTEGIQGSRAECAHGTTRKLYGEGMPIRRNGRSTQEFGNLVIRFVWPLSERASACCALS